jgi:hypothetical protein
MNKININKLLIAFNKVKNIKKLLMIYIKYNGLLIIYYTIDKIVKNTNLEYIMNLPYYFPIITTNITLHKNDIYTLYLLLDLSLNKYKIKYQYIVYCKKKFDLSVIQQYNKYIFDNDFYIIITQLIDHSDNNSYDHIMVYHTKTNYLYDVMDTNSKIYIQNTSCIINSLCFILDKINYDYNIQYILTLFKLFQLNNYIIDIIKDNKIVDNLMLKHVNL